MMFIKKKQNGQSHLELDVYKEKLYPCSQVTSTYSTYQENKLTSNFDKSCIYFTVGFSKSAIWSLSQSVHMCLYMCVTVMWYFLLLDGIAKMNL